jgi:hypothetical protein
MKTIGKIFIGALVAVGGYAIYMNWKKKQGGATTAPVTNPAAMPVQSAPVTTTPSPVPASVAPTNGGFASPATNPAATPIVVTTQKVVTMDPTIVQSAKDRFSNLIAGGGIANIVISPGYGIGYTQGGVARSARISEIEQNNADYIATFQGLINAAGLGKVA